MGRFRAFSSIIGTQNDQMAQMGGVDGGRATMEGTRTAQKSAGIQMEASALSVYKKWRRKKRL